MKKLHHIYFSTALLTLLAPAAGQSASFLPPHSTSFNIADSASLLKSKISLNSIGDASILRLDPKVLASEDDFFANNLVIKSADKTYPMVENAKKIAAVCFINDTSACADGMFGGTGDMDMPNFDMNAHDRCFNEGYTVNECPEWYVPGGKKCPYGAYYSECVYRCAGYESCEEPYHGEGEVCDGKYASCTCTPCGSEYTETEIPAGYEQLGEPCLDCDGQTKYQVVAAACEGFQICGDLGPIAGTETCLSGTTTLYRECKTCDNNGTLTTCPEGYDCTFEDCSGKWYITGCAVNYDNYCTTPITDCATLGYKSTSCSGRALRCPYNSAFMLCVN